MRGRPRPPPSAGDRRGAWKRRRPPSPHHHGFQHCEVWQKHVILHDVTGHLAEGPQISQPPINQDLPLHPRLPAERMVGDEHQSRLRTPSGLPQEGGSPSRVLTSIPHAHLYPAKMFMSVDLPAPEGPMMPISSRRQNLPDRHLRRVL